MEIREIKRFIENLNQDDISFDAHFYKRSRERPINEGMIRKFLVKPEKLEKIERGNNERLKLWFKMSGKYSLVLIVEIELSKDLKVISAWNNNRKWQKKIKRFS